VNADKPIESSDRLIIVTARSEATRREDTEIWVEKYFPNLFDEIWFSGEFAAVHSRLESRSPKPSLELVPAIKTGKTKAEVSYPSP
jgi:alpha-acetolactate decarboxylase